MLLPEGCTTVSRVVQAAIYTAAGIPEHTFSLPQPFSAEDFEDLSENFTVNADGVAKQLNQVLIENLINNLASRIKSVNERNSKVEEGGELESLPDQFTLDAMIEKYDFSGARASSGRATLPPVDREMLTLTKQFLRDQLRRHGLPAEQKPAPVTVAKGEAVPTDAQISSSDFLSLVQTIIDGEGAWGEEGTPQNGARGDLLTTAAQNIQVTRESEVLV